MITPDPTTEDYAAWEADTEGTRLTAAPSQWGIGLVPWLWATRVRILIVIDGRINVGYGEYGFGLGPVLDTLRDQSFAWWVRFEVTVRKRDPNFETAAFGRFRFTESGFDLDNFDQVWFFGDWPGEEPAGDPTVSDDVIDRPEFLPLDNDELRILAEWMERGGGVFAAGDHSLLGASMCSRIPRVRTMRKWKPSQGLPSFKGADRHETLQRAEGASELEPDEWNPEWEGDRYPQRIDPVYRYYLTPPFFFGISTCFTGGGK